MGPPLLSISKGIIKYLLLLQYCFATILSSVVNAKYCIYVNCTSSKDCRFPDRFITPNLQSNIQIKIEKKDALLDDFLNDL